MEKKERYVAYFDMLGFKAATLRNPSQAWNALTSLYHCKEKVSNYLIEISATKEMVKDRVKFFILSDSVLFFTLADQNVDLTAILIMASEIFGQTLHKCVPLRGGIAHGEFFYNLDLSIFAGVPFVKAHDIGGNAQWSGIIVDEIIAKRYFDNPVPTSHSGSIISQWGVSYKDGEVRESWVINWPDIFKNTFTKDFPISVEDYYAGFQNLFGSFEDLHEEDKLKYHNTVDFINSFKK